MDITHKTVKVFTVIEPSYGAFEHMLDTAEQELYTAAELTSRGIHLTIVEEHPRYVLERTGVEAAAASKHVPEPFRNICNYILRNTTVDDKLITIETKLKGVQ